MDFNMFKNKLFTKAIDQGFSEYELYTTSGENISVSVYEGEVEKYNLDKSFGLSFRGLYNSKMGYSYTEILDDTSIDMLITNAKASACVVENEDEEFIYKGDSFYDTVETYSNNLESIKADEIIEVALNLEKHTKAYSNKVKNINGCKVSYSNGSSKIYNSHGLELENKSNYLLSYVVPIIEENGVMQDGMSYKLSTSINDIDTKYMAKHSVEDALSKLNGKSITSGKYKVVIENEAMASLVETFVDIFDADNAQKGLSLLNNKEGEQVASNIVTIIDNPLLDYGLGSASFDDEGVKTYKKDIISNGKLITLLHNLKTANKANIKTTGNGFKASYASPVGIQPTNFHIKNGERSLDSILNDLGEIILLTDFAGMHSGANSITGDFSLAAKGYYIKDGKKEYPIEQITVAGNYFDLLKDIEVIANDLKFPLSNIGSPSVVVRELSIAGK